MRVGIVRSGLVVPKLRRQEPVSAAGVPVELLRRDEPLWGDPVASEAWFRRHGLVPGRLFEVGPACRRKEAVEGWALANGCARDDLPRLVDLHKVETLGIDRDWSSDAVRERVKRLK